MSAPPIQKCTREDHPDRRHGHYGYGGRYACTDFNSPLLGEANMGFVKGGYIIIFSKDDFKEKPVADNLNGIPFSSDDEGIDFPYMAKDIAYQFGANPVVNRKAHPTFSRDEMYVVWFGFVLGNWKAIISTSIPDGRMYEVTFSKDRGLAFVDTYMKTHNREVEIVPRS